MKIAHDLGTGEMVLVAAGEGVDRSLVGELAEKLAEALAIMKSAPVLEPDDWKQLASVIGKDETLAYVQALRAHSAKIKAFEESLKK